MAENHRALRLPTWLWLRYADVVGDAGRTPDLKTFIDWRPDHTDIVLGDDVAAPHDFTTTMRIDSDRWEDFKNAVAAGEVSAELRRYIWWKVRNPRAALPGNSAGLRAGRRRPALV